MWTRQPESNESKIWNLGVIFLRVQTEATGKVAGHPFEGWGTEEEVWKICNESQLTLMFRQQESAAEQVKGTQESRSKCSIWTRHNARHSLHVIPCKVTTILMYKNRGWEVIHFAMAIELASDKGGITAVFFRLREHLTHAMLPPWTGLW